MCHVKTQTKPTNKPPILFCETPRLQPLAQHSILMPIAANIRNYLSSFLTCFLHLHSYKAPQLEAYSSTLSINRHIVATSPAPTYLSKSNSSFIYAFSSSTTVVRSNFMSVFCKNAAKILRFPKSLSTSPRASGY